MAGSSAVLGGAAGVVDGTTGGAVDSASPANAPAGSSVVPGGTFAVLVSLPVSRRSPVRPVVLPVGGGVPGDVSGLARATPVSEILGGVLASAMLGSGRTDPESSRLNVSGNPDPLSPPAAPSCPSARSEAGSMASERVVVPVQGDSGAPVGADLPRPPSPGQTSSGAPRAQEVGSERLFPGQCSKSSPVSGPLGALALGMAGPVRPGGDRLHAWLGEGNPLSRAASLGSEFYDSASDGDGDLGEDHSSGDEIAEPADAPRSRKRSAVPPAVLSRRVRPHIGGKSPRKVPLDGALDNPGPRQLERVPY
eukprot:IDg3205t1